MFCYEKGKNVYIDSNTRVHNLIEWFDPPKNHSSSSNKNDWHIFVVCNVKSSRPRKIKMHKFYGRLKTKLYDKRDDFSFPIVIFPFLSSNIPAAPTYGVYISQLIRYSRACISYHDFLDRGLLLTRKLLNQEFQMVNWNHPFVNFTDAITSWLTVME